MTTSGMSEQFSIQISTGFFSRNPEKVDATKIDGSAQVDDAFFIKKSWWYFPDEIHSLQRINIYSTDDLSIRAVDDPITRAVDDPSTRAVDDRLAVDDRGGR